jgi:hypothetical protein
MWFLNLNYNHVRNNSEIKENPLNYNFIGLLFQIKISISFNKLLNNYFFYYFDVPRVPSKIPIGKNPKTQNPEIQNLDRQSRQSFPWTDNILRLSGLSYYPKYIRLIFERISGFKICETDNLVNNIIAKIWQFRLSHFTPFLLL